MARWIVAAALIGLSVGAARAVIAQSAPSPKTVQIDGTTLTYQEQGQGAPVVFIHGGFADHRIWEPQREGVAARHRFIALTMRYFGTTPWPDKGEAFSQETHVSDIAAFLQRLETRVVLVGRSYGGYTATLVALRHPELVRGLVVNEPPIASLLESSEDKAVLAADFAAMAAVQAAIKAGRNDDATRLFADWTNDDAGGFDKLPESARRMHLDNARTVPLQLTSARNIPISCAQLSQLKMPVSIVKGEMGRRYFKLIADAMHRCIPGSQLSTIAGARHGAPSEQPQAFNALLLSFLGALKP